jgi:AcrR family transcriptional regulator
MSGVTSRPQATARRKPASERQAEIIETAAAIAVAEGLDRVTAKRVAAELGVFPGLVSHYFATADELVATAFAHAAAGEREQNFGVALLADRPVDRMRRLLGFWLHQDRDPVSLLWLDAWQAGRRRPALMAEVGRQMNADLIAAGDFDIDDPGEPALQILSLVDGLSVQAATRQTVDYAPVRAMVIATAERLLALPAGTLAPAMES